MLFLDSVFTMSTEMKKHSRSLSIDIPFHIRKQNKINILLLLFTWYFIENYVDSTEYKYDIRKTNMLGMYKESFF